MREGKRKKISVWVMWCLILSICACGLAGCSGKKEEETTASGESKSEVSAESKSVSESAGDEDQSTAETAQTPLETEPVEGTEGAHTDSGSEKTDQEEDPQQQTEPDQDPAQEDTVSLENYIVNGEWKKIKDALNMRSVESHQFGEFGEGYEIDGFYINWSKDEPDEEGAFTMINTGSTSVDIYGVKVGDGIGTADSVFKENGWTSLNDGRQYIVIFNGRDLAIDFDLDENQTITGWYLCNWPEGDFSENFAGLVNQQVNGVPTKINVYEGEYMDEQARTWQPVTEYYTVIVENVTEDSFDFTIYYVNGSDENREVVFRTHTAIFEGDGTYARYHGQEYNLTFTFPDGRNSYPDAVEMQIDGYEPVEGLTFNNNSIPGHEFG